MNISGNPWVDVIGRLFDVIAPLVYISFGAVLAFLFSRMQRRKERLTENIYIPLLGHLGVIRDRIQDGKEMPVLDDLDKERQGGWYFTIDDKVKKKVDSAYEQLKDYQTMYNASEGSINKIIEEEVDKILRQLEEPERYRDKPYDVDYRGFIVHKHVGHANLRWCLLLAKTPLQFLRETRPKVKDSDIDCLIAGHNVPRRLVDVMCESALEKANADQVVQETRSQRQSLLRELQKLIELLTKQAVG